MHKIPVLLLLSFLPVFACTQYIHTLTNTAIAPIENYAVLPDHQYDLHKILTDTTLRFTNNDSLRPQQARSYWLKLTIANQFDEARSFILQTLPNLNNTIYYFDANSNKWLSDKNGILASSNRRRLNRDGLGGILRANMTNTIYVKLDISALPPSAPAFKPTLQLEQTAYNNNQEMIIRITWIASLTVLFLFFLNNVYIWFSFKDRTVLYYLIAQLGGIIYITAYKQIFPALMPNPVFNLGLQRNGVLGWYDVNQLLLHISIPVTVYSLVQFTRSYLHTPLAFPRLDAFFKYVLYAYLPVSALFLIITNTFYTEQYAWFFENMFTGLLFAAIVYAGILGYIRRLPAAPHFLLANTLSFGIAMAIPLYHLAVDSTSIGNPLLKTLLPDLVAITQSFGFSLALVARTRSIQQNLVAKEMEASRLEADLKELEHRHQLIEQENQQIAHEIQLEKDRNDHLQEKLAINQRELASSTLYIAQKNELLSSLKSQIREWKKQYPGKGLPDIESTLQNNLHLDNDWNKFRIHFEQVHPNFFEELQTNHPTLTKNEQRLCAYFHINLSTKEIATLLNIDPASVRRAKTRLVKKMGGKEETN